VVRGGGIAWIVSPSLSFEWLVSVSVSMTELGLFMLMLDLLFDAWVPPLSLSRRRPGRLVKKYWHDMPRLSHLEHDGFSLGHLTLDAAHAWQLSRSLELVPPVLRRADGWPCCARGRVSTSNIVCRSESIGKWSSSI
jgi:hypothetical protein